MFSPDDIAQRRFLVALRGYDRDEVTTFLQEVAGEVRSLRTRVAELQAEVARTETTASTEGVDPRTAFEALGQETTRILVAAEESAREIEARATAAAREQREQAQRDARETVETANRQAARTIAEAERRRDAIAAEIADLRAERDRFVEGLRASVASIGGVVGGLSQEDAEAIVDQVTAARPEEPATAEEPADVVVAPEPEDAAPPPATEPVVLDAPDDPVTTDEPEPVEAEPVEPEPAVEPEPVEPEPVEPEPVEPEREVEPEPAAEEQPADPEETPTVGSRRDATLAQVRVDMARQCKRALQEIQNEVLASIRDRGRKATLDDLLPGEPDLDDLGTQGAQHLATAYRGALVDAAAEVDADTPVDLAEGPRVPTAVATFRAVLAHEVTSALRATLRAGLEAEEPEPQLSERVGEVFRDLRGPVVEATVEEHLQRTYGYGLLDAWTELGVERVRWEARDEPRCPEGRCRTNAAEGDLPLGADFPSGDRVPPAHPGCTCVVVPA